VDVYLRAFLTSALDGGEWSASRSGRFIPTERAAGTHWIGGWFGCKISYEEDKDLTLKKKVNFYKFCNFWTMF